MKTLVVQVMRTQVKLRFPKEALFTISDMEIVKKCLKEKMHEGSFLMHTGQACTFKLQPHRKPIQMDLFTK
jgi:hypothetical protein